jgi:hypothetical protein
MSSSARLLLAASFLALGAAALTATPATAQTATTVVTHPIDETAQRATVDVRQVSLKVVYSGAPQFRPITGTSLAYAVNTKTPVIRVGAAYYAVEGGV